MNISCMLVMALLEVLLQGFEVLLKFLLKLIHHEAHLRDKGSFDFLKFTCNHEFNGFSELIILLLILFFVRSNESKNLLLVVLYLLSKVGNLVTVLRRSYSQPLGVGSTPGKSCCATEEEVASSGDVHRCIGPGPRFQVEDCIGVLPVSAEANCTCAPWAPG
ncbi:hypothetical protein F2P79_014875 [Pimephales promelas]|nr:hypothetical protein F2P79_014875 [Pimephales promelas]